MILNAFAVLDAFACALRLFLATVVVGQGIAALRQTAALSEPESKGALEDRFYLLFLLALLLLALNVLSWPLLYLLLQSYVPQWPEAMCIYGVIHVGTESQ